MGSRKEIAQVDKFAMIFVLHCLSSEKYLNVNQKHIELTINYSPSILPTAHLLSSHSNSFLRPHHCERYDRLSLSVTYNR